MYTVAFFEIFTFVPSYCFHVSAKKYLQPIPIGVSLYLPLVNCCLSDDFEAIFLEAVSNFTDLSLYSAYFTRMGIPAMSDLKKYSPRL